MKFFNSFRRKILGTGFGKYLLYALGEIILVVIGILLAISINDYYAQKDEASKHFENAQQIYHQMKIDSMEVNVYLKYLSELRETINYLRTPQEKREGLNKPLSAVNKLTLFADRDSDLINLTDLVSTQIENGDFASTNYAQTLYNIQVDYASDLRSIQAQEAVINDNNKRFNSYLADHYDWYVQWSSELNCNNDCMKFVGSSKQFDGMLASYIYEKTTIYGGRIKHFQDRLHWNMNKLHNLLKNQ